MQVAKMFPDMKVELLIWASSPPYLTVSPAGLALAPELEAQAFAVLPNSSLAPLFLLGLVSCSGCGQVGSPGDGPEHGPWRQRTSVTPAQIQTWSLALGPEMRLLPRAPTGIHSFNYPFLHWL